MARNDEWSGEERRSEESDKLRALTADIVSAHVSNNTVAVNDLPSLIANVFGALSSLDGPADPVAVAPVPKVSVRSSVKPEFIVCLECGAKQKMLKRHLATAHRLTVDEYRDRFGLAASYPMVAPDYAEQRRKLAVDIGLGRNTRKGK